jgi:hypothetical protein
MDKMFGECPAVCTVSSSFVYFAKQ